MGSCKDLETHECICFYLLGYFHIGIVNEIMKICAACNEELSRDCFSKKQWKSKQHERRCKNCIDANREVQAVPPTKNDIDINDINVISAKNPPTTSTSKMPSGPSCWICLDEGPDGGGQPLVRDCSCRGELKRALLISRVLYNLRHGRASQSKTPMEQCRSFWTRGQNARIVTNVT